MTERPQPRGFDVNQPGSARETFTGLAQGATTDLAGSVVDLGAAATDIASQVDPRLLSMSPTASLLSYLNPFAEQAQEVAGSEALGQRVFGDAPTEELQKIRDDARLVGGIAGLGEMLTAKGAKTVAGGIEDFMQFLPNVRAQAVTPEGSMLPLPEDTLPDSSITKMSADTPGAALKSAQALAKTLRGGRIPNSKTTTPQVFFPDLGENSHVTLQPDARNNAVSISYIVADTPGQGQGGEMLRRVTERADATGTRLTLYPQSEGGLDQDELIAFYQRNGFEFQYPDPTNPEPILDMVREPRLTAPKSAENLGVLGYKNPDTGDFIPDVFYHGTTDSFEDFKVGPSGAIYLSDNPKYAEEYAGVIPQYGSSGKYEPIVSEGANIRPVYIKDNLNIFNPENPKHANILREAGVPVDEINPYLPSPYDETFLELMRVGDYDAMESIAPVLKEKGFDGYQTYEGDTFNYAIFDPKNLVSATAKKAEGGVITLADVARNMSRGPRGVASLAPVARNMNRPMVS